MRQVTGRRLRKETVCIRRQQVVSMVRKGIGCRLRKKTVSWLYLLA